jgi:hypothetical protein
MHLDVAYSNKQRKRYLDMEAISMPPAVDQKEDCDGIEAVSSFSDTKFLLQQKVLCVDTNSFSSDDANAPLYEAVIRKSELKFIDPTTGNIIPDKKRGRGRGRQIVGASSSPTSGSSGVVLLQEWCHFIHFNGWNSRWDRWVKEQDLFHDTAANRKRVSDNIVGKVARPTSKQPKEDDKRDNKKRKRATTEPDRNLQLITRASELPFTLQTVLVDDRDKITTKVYPPPILFASKQQQQQQQRRKDKAITMLHVIPAPTSIVDLMGQYLQTKKQEDLEAFAKYHRGQHRDESGNSSCSSFDVGDGSSMDIAICITKSDLKANKKKRKEFALSILALFDASLPLFLLYAEERSQFTKLMSKEVIVKKDEAGDDKSSNGQQQPSHLYPAEYLLRLFVKIPNLLAEFDSKSKLLLSSNEKSQDFAKFLSELIVYIQKRVEEIFPGNYQAIEVQD